MKILITIPHVFSPKPGSLYSSQTETKRESKQKALFETTIGNLNRHRKQHWIHASLGYKKQVVTRQLLTNQEVDLTIQVYTKKEQNLLKKQNLGEKIEVYTHEGVTREKIPFIASMSGISQAENYDIIGYIEDDILIEDHEFFHKLYYFAYSEFHTLPIHFLYFHC